MIALGGIEIYPDSNPYDSLVYEGPVTYIGLDSQRREYENVNICNASIQRSAHLSYMMYGVKGLESGALLTDDITIRLSYFGPIEFEWTSPQLKELLTRYARSLTPIPVRTDEWIGVLFRKSSGLWWRRRTSWELAIYASKEEIVKCSEALIFASDEECEEIGRIRFPPSNLNAPDPK